MFCRRRRQRRIHFFGTRTTVEGLFAAFAFLVVLSACNSRSTPSVRPHYAVLRFENLSGDTSLDWVVRAASEALPVSLANAMDGPVLDASSVRSIAPALGERPASAPGASTEREDALAAGANRLISGYIEKTAGGIRITASEEDAGTGRSLRTVSATAASPIGALEKLAHELSPKAGPLPTSNGEALRAWATAMESPAAQRIELLNQAVRADPNLGPAWVALTTVYLGQGDRADAENTIEQARGHKTDAFSSANLELASADLGQDRAARIAALRHVVALSPADVLLLRSLADTETSAGEFQAAAADWKKLADESPNDALAWNSLGYARSYAGDYAGAIAALREYERLRPKDANPSDSIGDVNYFFGRFSEAANNYLEANRKQPGFEGYADFYKAAWAKFRTGDMKGADALMSRFRSQRLKASPSDGAVELLWADWLYRTKRESDAVAGLRKIATEAKSGVLQVDAEGQLAVWDLLQGDRARAAQDAALTGRAPAAAAVVMARFAAQPSASAAEWEMRASREFPAPAEAALRELAVGYGLLLDGKREAAIPVWERIVETAPATDFFARAVLMRLQGKTIEHPLLPDPMNLNQFAAMLDKL